MAVHVGLGVVSSDAYGHDLPAPGADRAASRLAALTTTAGFAPATVLVNAAATRVAITMALQTAAAATSASDLLCVSMSGHGVPRRDASAGEVALLAYDGPLLTSEWLAALAPAAGRVVFLVTACHGPLVAVADDDDTPTPAPRPRNLLVMSASPTNTIVPAAKAGQGVPGFVDALASVWTVARTYRDLQQRIAAVTTVAPVLVEWMSRDGLALERPFAIEAART